MLISHSLKCPYLHYKRCSQNSQKNSGREKPNLLFSIHQRCSAAETVFTKNSEIPATKNAALQSDFTFPFSVTFRCWFWSWKARFLEEHVSVVLQKIWVIPTEQPYIFKKSLFCWLCWAVWYTQEISQPHRITRSSRNNHCFTICLTHCEQGSLQHNRDGKVGWRGMSPKTKWIQTAA